MTAIRFWVGPLAVSACTAAGAWTAEARHPTGLSVAELEVAYLECDRLASADRMPPDLFALCATIAKVLLERQFDGDLERQLTWWRKVRRSPDPVHRPMPE